MNSIINGEISYRVTGDNELILLDYIGVKPIKSLTIPREIQNMPVVKINEAAFINKIVVSISIPDSIRVIGERAFHTSSIKEVVFEGKDTDIMAYAFAGTSLNSIDLPENIKTVTRFCFAQSSLKRCNWHNATLIDDCAFYKSGLERADFSHIHYIYAQAFADCKHLKNIEWGNTLKLIGEESFAGVPLTGDIKIPRSVEIIRNNAFGDADVTLYIPDDIRDVGTQKQNIILY